jgi:hypothetical protein
MRYSVVLPRVEPTDAEGARRALDRAQELWTKGEQRAALEHVRQAAEAANATGQKARALALSRSVTMLARAIGSSSLPPPVVSEAPAVSAPRRKTRNDASVTADTQPAVAAARPIRDEKNAAPKPPPGVAAVATSATSQRVTAPSPVAVGRISAPMVAAAPRRVSAPEIAAAPVSILEAPADIPSALAAATEAALPESIPPEDVDEDSELIVTVAPADWNLESPNALIGHSAQRVAVAPGRGPGGTLMVRPLAPGEVAPKGSTIAVMVALEPGVQPLPRAG